MKRPSFQWYPGDWRNNAKLRRCSFHERGVWIEVIGLLHDSDEYGVLRWPARDIAQAVGCKVGDVQALTARAVLKGIESGPFPGFYYTPRHSKKDGPTVCLIPPCDGPIYYSSRLVVDEYVRQVRGSHGQKGAPEPPPSNGTKGGIGSGLPPPPSSSSSSKDPPIPPGGGDRKSKRSSRSITFDAFADACNASGEKRISADDPIHAWAEEVNLPNEFLRIAWVAFRDNYSKNPKRYQDWRRVFRTSVKRRWFKLWYIDREGLFVLTTEGETVRRQIEADEARRKIQETADA